VSKAVGQRCPADHYREAVSSVRKLVLIAGILAAAAGVVSATGTVILRVSAATGGSFPFGAAFLVFFGGPILFVALVPLAIAAVEQRRVRPPR
jgi:hypothetical protein